MAHFFGQMKQLLKRIGLFDSFTTEVKASPQTLVDKFSKITDSYQPDLFDSFTFDKKEYKGFVTTEKFELKKRKWFLISSEHWAEAFGEIRKLEDRTVVKVDIYSMHAYLVVIGFSLTSMVFLISGLGSIVYSLINSETNGIVAGLAILLVGFIMIGIPFFRMRWSVQNLKWDLESELKKLRE